ncbi:MAG: DNA/RNA non-specific endonuclease [Lactobacillus delbrueckii]|nr:DNA/RNA non-specific endonuclease [Lactobacillus delbrueckii]
MKKTMQKLTALLLASASLLVASTAKASSLADRDYQGQKVITVNQNRPTFSKKTLSTKKGAWQSYHNLDSLNRAGEADALLNKRLMPTKAREPLYWNPTAWHNKKITGGWLYNRSHLIGYQLTGQNNNPKNLITGTRQLNDPGMLKYENQVASYLKSSSRHYIRYRVKPIFRGRELLARGVEMEAQSTGSNAVRFHVYIFNVQDGVKLNYSNGTSLVTGAAKKSAKKTVVKKAAAKKSTSSKKKIKTSTTGRIVGNRRSKIYHVPGQAGYHMNSANAVYFRTETEAKRAGYRRALR